MADSQNHDCKDLANRLGWHDTRLQKLEEFRNQTTIELQASKSFHENMLKEMAVVSAETKSIASNQQIIQVAMGEERGRRDQSTKTLYLFISIMGVLPTLAIVLLAFKPVGH